VRQYWIVLLISFLTFSGQVSAEPDTQKIEQLLDMTGALALGEQLGKEMMKQMAPMFPEKAQPLLQELTQALRGDDYKALIVGLYQQNFTESEVDALITFYSSPAGQSIIKKMPTVMQESMKIGGVFGQMKAREILERMRQEGYEPSQI